MFCKLTKCIKQRTIEQWRENQVINLQSLESEYKKLDSNSFAVESAMLKAEDNRSKAILDLDIQYNEATKIDPKIAIKQYLSTIKNDFSALVQKAQSIQLNSLQGRFVKLKPYTKVLSSNPNEIFNEARKFCESIYPKFGDCSIDEELIIIQKASDIAAWTAAYLENFDTLYDNYAKHQEYISNIEVQHRKDVQRVESEFENMLLKFSYDATEITDALRAVSRNADQIFENERISAFSGCDGDYPAALILGGFEGTLPKSAMGKEVLPKGLMSPFVINLVKPNEGCSDCNIFIEWDGESKEVYEFIKNYMLKAVLNFPAKYCKIDIAAFDTDAVIDYAIAPADTITYDKKTGEQSITQISSHEALIKKLEELRSNINDNRIVYRRDGVSHIAEYNNRASDNPHPAKFLILYDYPNGYSSEVKKLLHSIIKGNYCGIYLVVIRNKKKTEKQSYETDSLTIESIFANSLKITINQSGTSVNGRCIIYNLYDDMDLSSVKDTYRKVAKKTKAIFLHEILESRWEEDVPSKLISIPFGKSGSEIRTLDFDIANAPISVIAGKAGSGKTIFLHSLILSGATKYSPEELQFYIIDLKQDVEFGCYDSDERRIPHIRAIADVGDKNPIAARGMLQSLVAEMIRRNGKLFKIGHGLGVKNIFEYNDAIERGIHIKKGHPNFKKIPRIIVIIDEYTVLYNTDADRESQNLLLTLANQGRSSGISLVLASQGIPTTGNFDEVMKQAESRIAFKCDSSILRLMFNGCGNNDNVRHDNILEKGAAYFSYLYCEPRLCRGALPAVDGDIEGWERYSAEIRAKYPIDSSSRNRLMRSGNMAYFDFCDGLVDLLAEENSRPDEEGNIDVPLGISVASGVPLCTQFGEEDRVFYMIGDDNHNKNIEALMILGLLQKRRMESDYLEAIEYIDYRKDTESHPALIRIFTNFSTLVRITEAKSVGDIQPCDNRLAEIIYTAKTRLDKSNTKPIFVFLSCYNDIMKAQTFEGGMTNAAEDLRQTTQIDNIDDDGLSPREKRELALKRMTANRNVAAQFISESTQSNSERQENKLQTLIELSHRSNIYIIVHFDSADAFGNAKILPDFNFRLGKAIFTSGSRLKEVADRVRMEADKHDAMSIDARSCAVYTDGKEFMRVRRVIFTESDKLETWFKDFAHFIGQKQ